MQMCLLLMQRKPSALQLLKIGCNVAGKEPSQDFQAVSISAALLLIQFHSAMCDDIECAAGHGLQGVAHMYVKASIKSPASACEALCNAQNTMQLQAAVQVLNTA